MPAPLPGAGSLRHCSAKSKEEVLANFAAYWKEKDNIDTKNGASQHAERLEKRAKHQLMLSNLSASFYPVWLPTGPMQPSRSNDDRFRDFIGRYGNMRND